MKCLLARVSEVLNLHLHLQSFPLAFAQQAQKQQKNQNCDLNFTYAERLASICYWPEIPVIHIPKEKERSVTRTTLILDYKQQKLVTYLNRNHIQPFCFLSKVLCISFGEDFVFKVLSKVNNQQFLDSLRNSAVTTMHKIQVYNGSNIVSGIYQYFENI